MTDRTTANRLTLERSAYLKSAAHQPVHWHPWGEEALSLAKELDRPILVDVGAVWCHWCHVMDGESYENPEIARLINDKFVAIKVDRDERPDVDSRLQRAVSAVSGQGGWPLTAFLTPEGEVFFGGTYFPPEDRWGRPGFRTVLERVAELYQTDRARLQQGATDLATRLKPVSRPPAKPEALTVEMVDEVLATTKAAFDFVYGGFGGAPKFPHPSVMELSLARYDVTRQPWLLAMVTQTLEAMGKGGVYDQIGGGFHRYSTDERWIVPHFEKMVYDNAGLLKVYLETYQATGRALFREIAEGIIFFVDTVLSDRDGGGFFASQDADVGLHDDGDYFTWTEKELMAALLGPPFYDDLKIMKLHYGIQEKGPMHHHPEKNVLHVEMDAEAIAKRLGRPEEEVIKRIAVAKQRLLEVRHQRPVPFVDRTVYTHWNGMMISAFLSAYKVLGREDCKAQAMKTLDLVMNRAFSPTEGMAHALTEGEARVRGQLDDQIWTVQALLDMHEVTGRAGDLQRAEALMTLMFERFWDPQGGGFFDTDGSATIGLLRQRYKNIQDAPSSSSNGVAGLCLIRLYHLTGNEAYRDRARALLSAFVPEGTGFGYFAASYALSVEFYLRPPLQAVIVGPPDDPRTASLQQAALTTYRPWKVLRRLDPTTVKDMPLPEVLRGMIRQAEIGRGPLAFICAGSTCAAPTEDPKKVAELVRAFGRET